MDSRSLKACHRIRDVRVSLPCLRTIRSNRADRFISRSALCFTKRTSLEHHHVELRRQRSGGTLGEPADWKRDTGDYPALETAVHRAPGCLDLIKPQMPVLSGDGCRVGTVDCLIGGCIKLFQKDSPDGLHHFIPFNWIERVEDKVYLTKNANETRKEWDLAIGA
jgi:hypothetical protein